MKKILLCILVFAAAGYFVVMETETGQDQSENLNPGKNFIDLIDFSKPTSDLE